MRTVVQWYCERVWPENSKSIVDSSVYVQLHDINSLHYEAKPCGYWLAQVCKTVFPLTVEENCGEKYQKMPVMNQVGACSKCS